MRGVAVLLLAALGGVARAQRGSSDFGMTYTQERSNQETGTFFYLRGASVDYGYTLWHGLGVTGSATGLAVTNLNGNEDIHQIEFAGGPRFTYNLGHISPTRWGRRGGAFAEGKVGYTFATSGVFPVNGTITDHAAALTYAAGGGINVHVYERFDLRLIEGEYVRTQLPNGSNNVQNSVRLSAGLNFHFGR